MQHTPASNTPGYIKCLYSSRVSLLLLFFLVYTYYCCLLYVPRIQLPAAIRASAAAAARPLIAPDRAAGPAGITDPMIIIIGFTGSDSELLTTQAAAGAGFWADLD